MKYAIVNADDLGWSPAVNRGIMEALGWEASRSSDEAVEIGCLLYTLILSQRGIFI